ncbi:MULTISPECIES: hypothetical protein [unclassified Streptomyces]|uniref:hypothetical protein n=1 Tax=unclassified Streptomyces TaxID=2593676 RepID=UPI00364E2275
MTARLRTLALPLLALVTTWTTVGGVASADTIEPDGASGLLPAPTVPASGRTMFEAYPHLLTWRLDKDFGDYDFLDPALHVIADLLVVILVTVGSGVTTLAEWSFGLIDMPEIQGPLTQAISGSAGAVMVGIFPSALAVGALVAFFRSQRGDGAGYTDLAWVLVSAVVAATLLQTPQTWVDGVDTGRTVGAELAMTATEGGIGSVGGGIEGTPFKLAQPSTYPGEVKDRVVRRSSDTVWRVYVATPWCLAEFGSLEICKKYGREVLDFQTDTEKRKEFLKQKVNGDSVGAESQSWRQGHRPLERAGVLLVAVPVALLFGILLITLLLGSITALMGGLFLLIVGPFFAALWVIPGRPRQWGVRWADALVGTVLQSAIVTLTAGAVMMLQMVTAMAMPTYGWLGSSALSIAGAVTAFKYRAILVGIVGGGAAGGGGSMGAVLGVLATRGLSRVAGGVVRAPGKIAGRIGDKVEERHRRPAPAPPRPRPTPPPPPPGGHPTHPRPRSGPGRGPGTGGTGGTGPSTTIAKARRPRRPGGTGPGTGGVSTGTGTDTTAPPATVPAPGRRGRLAPEGAPAGTVPARRESPDPAAPAPTGAARRPRPGTAPRQTQPPAPVRRRTPRPPAPRTPRPRTGRRYPPPPPRT